MTGKLHLWIRRQILQLLEPWLPPPGSEPAGASPLSRHHPRPHSQNSPRDHSRPSHAGLPSYQSLYPHDSEGREATETIRARHPPLYDLGVPQHKDSQMETAYAAASLAVNYMAEAMKYDDRHGGPMIAARIAHGISMAVSTSQSHLALVAAVNAVESTALLLYEAECNQMFDATRIRTIGQNALDTAVDRALAQQNSEHGY